MQTCKLLRNWFKKLKTDKLLQICVANEYELLVIFKRSQNADSLAWLQTTIDSKHSHYMLLMGQEIFTTDSGATNLVNNEAFVVELVTNKDVA